MGVCVELRVRRGRRSCGALGIMTARVATASIIRSNGRSGHGGSCMSCGSVGPSILSRPSTGPPSRHWTAGFGPPGPLRGARRAHRLPAAGRCPDSGDRTDVAGSRGAPGSLHPAHRPDASPTRRTRALAPSDDATGDEAMGVYSELRGFIQTYRTCGIRIGARLDGFMARGTPCLRGGSSRVPCAAASCGSRGRSRTVRTTRPPAWRRDRCRCGPRSRRRRRSESERDHRVDCIARPPRHPAIIGSSAVLDSP